MSAQHHIRVTREIVWTRPCGYCRNKAREAVR